MDTPSRASIIALDARWRLAAAGAMALAFWATIGWAMGWY